MKKWLEKLKYLIPIIGSYLGALGGQGVKEWRRFVLPAVLATLGYLNIGWWGLLLGTFGGFASMGYGIPSYDFLALTVIDEGSFLGRFWYKIFNRNHRLTDIFTRGTVGIGMCLSGLVLPIFKGNWMFYFIGCLFIIIGQIVFSYRGWGEVKVFGIGKKVLVSDLINYGFIFTGYTIMLATI